MIFYKAISALETHIVSSSCTRSPENTFWIVNH